MILRQCCPAHREGVWGYESLRPGPRSPAPGVWGDKRGGRGLHTEGGAGLARAGEHVGWRGVVLGLGRSHSWLGRAPIIVGGHSSWAPSTKNSL